MSVLTFINCLMRSICRGLRPSSLRHGEELTPSFFVRPLEDRCVLSAVALPLQNIVNRLDTTSGSQANGGGFAVSRHGQNIDISITGGQQTIDVGAFHSSSAVNLTIRGDATDTVRLVGPLDLGGGRLDVFAGSIDVSGAIRSRGGTVNLDAGNVGSLLVSGTIDVGNPVAGGIGGTVHLLGQRVGLFDGAQIDASGDLGGGSILVGGDYHGVNPGIRDAAFTFVGQDVQITADAMTRGDGGHVVVWANVETQFQGNIIAQGGNLGGNGGFVEVSGHSLDFRGSANTAASRGAAGTLLLDPTDLQIVSADLNVTASTPFQPVVAGVSTLSWTTLDTALVSSNVVVTTVGSPNNGQLGNITVGVAHTWNSTHKLTFSAAGSVLVNSAIGNTSSGSLEIDAAAGVTISSTISLTGTLTINSGGPVTQSSSITAAGLELLGSGTYSLTNSGNSVTTLAGTTTNTIAFSNSGALAIGTVNTVGLTSTGAVSLTATDAVTQSQKVLATTLTVKTTKNGGTAITLNNTANDVTTIDLRSRNAADSADDAGAISYTDATGFAVAAANTTSTVTLTAGDAITQSGAATGTTLTVKTKKTGGAAITLNAANAFTTIDLRSRNTADSTDDAGAISYTGAAGFAVADVETTANATLHNGGAVTQSGPILASGLELLGSGSYSLTNSGNSIATLAGNTTNTIAFSNSGALAIGTVNTVGLTSTGAVSLTATDAVTQSQKVLATTLAVKTTKVGGAAITLNSSANDVTTIDLRSRNAADSANAAGAITYTDATGFAVAAANTTSTVTLTAGNAITQTGAATGITLTVKTKKTGGAAISLNAANNFSTIDLQARNTVDSADDAGAISYTGASGFAVADVETTAKATLHNGGAVTQSGAILASGLELLGSGSYSLTNSGNSVTTLAGNTTDTITFANSGVLAIGTVNTVGLTSTAAVSLTATDAVTQSRKIAATTLTVKTTKDGGAAITLNNAANDVTTIDLQSRNAADSATAAGAIIYADVAGFTVAAVQTTANATLQNGGAVTQGGAIVAAGLELLGSGSYSLTNSGNSVSTLAGNTTDTIAFANSGVLAIGTVNTVGLTSTAAVSLTATDAVTQSQEIAATTLTVKTTKDGGAAITLNNAANDVTTIDLRSRNAADSATAAGAIIYADVAGFAVAATQTTDNVTLHDGGAVNQSGAILAAGLELLGSGSYSLTNSGNSITTLAGNTTNAITFNTSGPLVIGTVNTVGLASTAAVTLTAGDEVKQSQKVAATTLTVKTMKDGGAVITLDNAANDVATINLRSRNAADSANAAGVITYTDATGFAVAAANTTSTVTLTAGDAITQTGSATGTTLTVKTKKTGGAAITLNAANNFSTIDLRARNTADSADDAGAISYTGAAGFAVADVETTANATLRNGGAVTQSGPILASGLELLGSGGYNLTNSGNLVITLAGNTTNTITFANSGALAIGTVNTVGLTSTAVVSLTATDAVTQSQKAAATTLTVKTTKDGGAAITLDNPANDVTTIDLRSRNSADLANAAGVISYSDVAGFAVAAVQTTANATLQNNGTVTQSGAILASGLELLGSGSYNLTNAGNSITTLAGNTTSTIAFSNSGAMAIGTVNTVGLTSTAAVSLTATDEVKQNQKVAATTLTVKTTKDGGAVITLDNPANNVASIDLRSRNAADSANDAGAITFVDTTGFDIAGIATTSTATLTTGGTVTQSGVITTGGTLTLSSTSANTDFLLASQANNVAGGVLFTGTTSSIRDFALRNVNVAAAIPSLIALSNLRNLTLQFDNTAIVLPALTITGSLKATAGGPITQIGLLTVNGAGTTATLAAGSANDITLNNPGNDFTEVIVTSGKNVTIQDVNALQLGNVTASGNLAVTANGPITQATATALIDNNPGATATFASGPTNDISLGNSGNDFATVGFSGANVTLTDANDLDIGTSLATGNVIINAGGAISQSGPIVASNAGTVASFQAGSGKDITLGNVGNDFATVVFGGNNVTLTDANGLDLGASAATGNVSINTSGAITQSGAISASSVGTMATFAAGSTNDITLNNVGNNFAGVAVTSGNNVVVQNSHALRVGPFNVAGGVNLTAVGMTVSGTVHSASGDLVLNAQSGTFSILSGAGLDTLGKITITADSLALDTSTTPAAIRATGTSSTVSLIPFSAATPINLGTGAASGFAITGAELNTITTSGVLTIGSPTSNGGITVVGTADLTTGGITGPLVLRTHNGMIAVNAALIVPAALTLQTDGGNITFGQATGLTALRAGGIVTLSAVSGAIVGNSNVATDVATPSSLSLTAASGIGASNNLETAAGAIAFSNVSGRVGISDASAAGVTVSGSNGIAAPVEIIESAGSLTVAAPGISTQGGTISLSATSANKAIAISAGSAVDSTIAGVHADISLTADNMDIAGTIRAGAGKVAVAPFSSATQIKLGAGIGADVPGELHLTDAELNAITTALLTIGSSTGNGGITVAGTANLTLGGLSGPLLLRSHNGTIAVNAALTAPAALTLQTDGGNITFGQAAGVTALQAGGSVVLSAAAGAIAGNPNAATDVASPGTLTLTAATDIGGANNLETVVGQIAFNNVSGMVGISNTMSTGVTVSGSNGIAGPVSIAELAGNLTVGTPGIRTQGGVISLIAAAANKAIVVSAGTVVDTTISGAHAGISLVADNMDISGTIRAGSSAVVLAPRSNTTQVKLGAGVGPDVPGELHLTNTEINAVAAGMLTIGSPTDSGAVTVAGAFGNGAGTPKNLALISGPGNILIDAKVGFGSPFATIALNTTGLIQIGPAGELVTVSGAISNVPPILRLVPPSPSSPIIITNTTQTVTGTAGGDPLHFPADNLELGQNLRITVKWDDGITATSPAMTINAGDTVNLFVNQDGTQQQWSVTPGSGTGPIQLTLAHNFSFAHLVTAGAFVTATVTVANDPSFILRDSRTATLGSLGQTGATASTPVAGNQFVPPPDRPSFVKPETVVATGQLIVPISQQPDTLQPAEPVEYTQGQGEKVEEQSRHLTLVKVGPDGQEEVPHQLPDDALQRLNDLFERFKKMGLPNGLYRIYIEEAGFPKRQLREFFKSGDVIGDPVREPGRGSNRLDQAPAKNETEPQDGATPQGGPQNPDEGKPQDVPGSRQDPSAVPAPTGLMRSPADVRDKAVASMWQALGKMTYPLVGAAIIAVGRTGKRATRDGGREEPPPPHDFSRAARLRRQFRDRLRGS